MTDVPTTLDFDRAGLMTLPFEQAPCQCVKTHRPKPLTTERHHIFPVGLQQRIWGQVRMTYTVPLCGTAHNNVHKMIDALLRGDPLDARGNDYLEELARRGYDLYMGAKASV